MAWFQRQRERREAAQDMEDLMDAWTIAMEGIDRALREARDLRDTIRQVGDNLSHDAILYRTIEIVQALEATCIRQMNETPSRTRGEIIANAYVQNS